MSSTIGEHVRITIFGESHGPAVGVVMDGLPAGEPVDMEALQAFMDRRAPGRDALASRRREADRPRLLSGLVGGVTCGAPLCAVIENTDAHSVAYEALRDLPRPGHADYTAAVRYGGHADQRGGGHLSGRLTAPLCVAGGIAIQLLSRRGVTVGAHILSVSSVKDTPFDPMAPDARALLLPGRKAFPVLDDTAGEDMRREIEAARDAGDSVGGVVECCAAGLPAGLGDPIFGGVESRLAAMLYGIPAVRGVSFGEGFASGGMRGSAHNDAFHMRDGKVVTCTNHHGGVLGGITTGMPLRLEVAFKPTPSIAMPQQTVNLKTREAATIAIEGRHDPCIVPRAVPCVEAVVAIVLLDMLCGGGYEIDA